MDARFLLLLPIAFGAGIVTATVQELLKGPTPAETRAGFGTAIPAAILGTALAYVFHKTRSLWPCILLHSTYNALAYVAALSSTC